MKFLCAHSFISLIILALLKGVRGATAIVYCESPYSVANPFSYCGESVTATNVFPGTDGYAAMNDDAIISTSIWTSGYISIHSSLEIISTSVYQAAYVGGVTCSAKLMLCHPTKTLFYATISHFTVFAPTGDIATLTDVMESTVTATVTSTVTATTTTTLSGTLTITEVSTSTVTDTSILLSSVTFTKTDTTTITDISTVTEGEANETLTITIIEGSETCSTAEFETVTSTRTILDPTTVITSVTYCIGSTGGLTIYTSGSVPGTSTFTSCF